MHLYNSKCNDGSLNDKKNYYNPIIFLSSGRFFATLNNSCKSAGTLALLLHTENCKETARLMFFRRKIYDGICIKKIAELINRNSQTICNTK